jgi:hypothetical protein
MFQFGSSLIIIHLINNIFKLCSFILRTNSRLLKSCSINLFISYITQISLLFIGETTLNSLNFYHLCNYTLKIKNTLNLISVSNTKKFTISPIQLEFGVKLGGKMGEMTFYIHVNFIKLQNYFIHNILTRDDIANFLKSQYYAY